MEMENQVTAVLQGFEEVRHVPEDRECMCRAVPPARELEAQFLACNQP